MTNKDTAEFFEALKLLEKEKGIPAEYLLDKIRAAIVIAVKKDYGGEEENVIVRMDPATGEFRVALRKNVVEEITQPDSELLLDEALRYNKNARVGEFVDIELETKQFGRIAAQTAKHVIRQGIREAEHGKMREEIQSKNQEIVTAKVSRIDPETGDAIVEIGKSQELLLKSEQIPGEVLAPGDLIKVYVADVRDNLRRMPRATISRKHPGLVRRLFETEVPEIYDGTVEIKAVSREAGSRTKIAVYSADENVDAVGACIGPRGARVGKIVDMLYGEKIDIVKYSEDPKEFIAASLAPADVVSVTIDENAEKSCRVIVPDLQLSLAIGNKGQNARLAAKLTGWKIDIKPESGKTDPSVEL